MLELIDLHKRYGDVVALDGCSFRVEPGRVVGFLGPNGSGKTTAMRAIFGLVHLDGGALRWQRGRLSDEARSSFGYMPESRGLYPRMRVREQIVYFARLHGLTRADAGAQADSWLERLGLADRADERMDALSHGNQQRIQLAVALAHRGDLLVLDEPFSGLDPIGVASLGEIVREEAARGACVLFSSHQLDLVEDLCEDVAIINRGRIVLSGDVQRVRAASPHRYVEASIAGRNGGGHWPPSAGGVEVLWERGPATRLRVPVDADPGALLASAEREGAVEYFRFEPPSLSDLFMEAVAP